ncbi:MAG: hypothetical protein Q4G49_10445 [Paracoccus sp. (in: a-proteobacteria)]|nr:hypothetical protein [Paracoccus sp. (in: a-proteobacteria)]
MMATSAARRSRIVAGQSEIVMNSVIVKAIQRVRSIVAKTIPQTHKLAEDAAHIEIFIKNSEPIDLLDFTASLTGIAREHEAQVRASTPQVSVDETRLLIVDVRKGSIILELLPVLAPFVSTAEVTNTAVAFVENMRAAVTQLSQPGGRIQNATTTQLKNLNDTVRLVADDAKGELSIAARYKSGDVIQEIVIDKKDAQVIEANVTAQRKEIEAKGSAQYERVLMRLHQSSADGLKLDKRTSEKGIVERIDITPRTLIYASDRAGERIKNEILNGDGNPFQKGFIVDLDVETVGGKPRVYRILDVHEVIDLDEEE